MRKEANMFLRGGTWTLRIAVPKDILAIRKELGKRSTREVWKSLGTGDAKAAQLRLAHARAEVLQGFEDERQAFGARPVPTPDQLRHAGALFRDTVKASLLNERLQELASPSDVARAGAELTAAVASGYDADETLRASRLYHLEWLVGSAAEMDEDRAELRSRLWTELKAMDPKSVDGFIGHIAKVNGFKIVEDGPEYRHLARLLQAAWIEALDDAESAIADTTYVPLTQAEVLGRWDAPLKQSGLVPLEASETPARKAHEASMPAQPSATRVRQDIIQLHEDYLSERFPKLSESGRLERVRNVTQFVEVCGLKEPTEYRKKDMAAFKQALLKLPPNAARDFPGQTVSQILSRAKPTSASLADKTVRLRLSHMSAFGKWMANNVDGVDAANFATSAPSAKNKPTTVGEFSDEQIVKIFHSPSFVGCQSERNQLLPGSHKVRDYRFWLPLLAAFTGCRLNELTQLRLDDIQQIGDQWVLNITADAIEQSLKTKASARIVPIHSQVLGVGFLARVDRLRQQGHEVLFPEIPLDRNGRRSEAAGKRFRKFIARLGIKDDGIRGGFHRFRHGVVERLRLAGHSDYEIALVVGHDTGIASMTAKYGSTRQLMVDQRKAMVEALTYKGLDTSRLR